MENNRAMIRAEISRQEWLEKINAQKSSGLTVKEWCSENGIGVKRFYYHQKKLQDAYCEQIAVPIRLETASNPAAVIHSEHLTVEITNTAAPEIIRNILGCLQC